MNVDMIININMAFIVQNNTKQKQKQKKKFMSRLQRNKKKFTFKINKFLMCVCLDVCTAKIQ